MNISPAETLATALGGDRLALSRSLTLYENGELSGEEISSLGESSSEFPVVGITGAPGVGKSCIIDHIVQSWSSAGHRVAVIAVDPTSPITGGALLGDRLRMTTADSSDNVFFRSIATRRHGGSVPGIVRGMLSILRAGGWNRCIVETVGAGQGEIRISAVAELIVLLEAPGRGDGVQAEKAGLIELADLIVVNKSDLDGAEKTADEWETMLNDAAIPAARVRRLDEAMAHEQVVSRTVLQSYPGADRTGVPNALPVAAFTYNHGGPKADGRPPKVGEHTIEVMKELAYDAVAISDLEERGIIAACPPKSGFG